jgi:macrolide-specific efflux system membrane fusion protein
MNLFKNKKITIVASLVGLFIIGYWLWQKGSQPKIEYKEMQLKHESIEKNILATGVVQPKSRIEIKSPIAGRVERILNEEGTTVKKGQTLIWISSTERAALIDAARASGGEDLKKWQEYYQATPILAPIGGTIIQKKLQQGQTFSANEGILVMADKLIIQAQVDETDIAQIKKDQLVTIVLDAYPENKINASVDKIAYDAKTVNNVTTYTVDLAPDTLPDFFRSGMTANVTFNIERKVQVLVIPAEAVKKNPSGESYTLIKGLHGKPQESILKLGISDGKKIEVLMGLNDNDTVLVPQIKLNGSKSPGNNPFTTMGGNKSRSR